MNRLPSVRLLLPAIALVLAFAIPQEPVSPPPQPAPVGTPAPHPFAGVYRLRQRVVDGVPDTKPNTGFLAITHRHLFLQLAAPGSDPDLPLLRTGVRTWTAKGDQLQGVVQLGWYTDAAGGVHLERPGTTEQRRLEVLRGQVRLYQDENSYLEFERVE